MPDITYECRPATTLEHERTALKLREHTEAALGEPVAHRPFGLLAYEGNRMVGSIVGKIFLNWLHVDLIWVDEPYRGSGIGSRLMQHAERQARGLGLSGIEVWTQSWQAPGFYKKLGYLELAVLEDFTPGKKRHVFRRTL